MGKKTIGDPENKAGLAPCDHALAMATAWRAEFDRLGDSRRTRDDDPRHEKALGEWQRWEEEYYRLFGCRHGIFDISTSFSRFDASKTTIWIGTDTSGNRAIYRDRAGEDGEAASSIAGYFIDKLALAEARVGMQSRSLSGKSTVVFTLQRKREVKVGNEYRLEDTGYMETEWRFGAKWSVEVRVDPPLLTEDDHRVRNKLGKKEPKRG